MAGVYQKRTVASSNFYQPAPLSAVTVASSSSSHSSTILPPCDSQSSSRSSPATTSTALNSASIFSSSSQHAFASPALLSRQFSTSSATSMTSLEAEVASSLSPVMPPPPAATSKERCVLPAVPNTPPRSDRPRLHEQQQDEEVHKGQHQPKTPTHSTFQQQQHKQGKIALGSLSEHKRKLICRPTLGGRFSTPPFEPSLRSRLPQLDWPDDVHGPWSVASERMLLERRKRAHQYRRWLEQDDYSDLEEEMADSEQHQRLLAQEKEDLRTRQALLTRQLFGAGHPPASLSQGRGRLNANDDVFQSAPLYPSKTLRQNAASALPTQGPAQVDSATSSSSSSANEPGSSHDHANPDQLEADVAALLAAAQYAGAAGAHSTANPTDTLAQLDSRNDFADLDNSCQREETLADELYHPMVAKALRDRMRREAAAKATWLHELHTGQHTEMLRRQANARGRHADDGAFTTPSRKRGEQRLSGIDPTSVSPTKRRRKAGADKSANFPATAPPGGRKEKKAGLAGQRKRTISGVVPGPTLEDSSATPLALSASYTTPNGTLRGAHGMVHPYHLTMCPCGHAQPPSNGHEPSSPTFVRGKHATSQSHLSGAGADEEEAAMVQCDACNVWHHLACVGIESVDELGDEWYCGRCYHTAGSMLSGASSTSGTVAPSSTVASSGGSTFMSTPSFLRTLSAHGQIALLSSAATAGRNGLALPSATAEALSSGGSSTLMLSGGPTLGMGISLRTPATGTLVDSSPSARMLTSSSATLAPTAPSSVLGMRSKMIGSSPMAGTVIGAGEMGAFHAPSSPTQVLVASRYGDRSRRSGGSSGESRSRHYRASGSMGSAWNSTSMAEPGSPLDRKSSLVPGSLSNLRTTPSRKRGRDSGGSLRLIDDEPDLLASVAPRYTAQWEDDDDDDARLSRRGHAHQLRSSGGATTPPPFAATPISALRSGGVVTRGKHTSAASAGATRANRSSTSRRVANFRHGFSSEEEQDLDDMAAAGQSRTANGGGPRSRGSGGQLVAPSQHSEMDDIFSTPSRLPTGSSWAWSRGGGAGGGNGGGGEGGSGGASRQRVASRDGNLALPFGAQTPSRLATPSVGALGGSHAAAGAPSVGLRTPSRDLDAANRLTFMGSTPSAYASSELPSLIFSSAGLDALAGGVGGNGGAAPGWPLGSPTASTRGAARAALRAASGSVGASAADLHSTSAGSGGSASRHQRTPEPASSGSRRPVRNHAGGGHAEPSSSSPRTPKSDALTLGASGAASENVSPCLGRSGARTASVGLGMGLGMGMGMGLGLGLDASSFGHPASLSALLESPTGGLGYPSSKVGRRSNPPPLGGTPGGHWIGGQPLRTRQPSASGLGSVGHGGSGGASGLTGAAADGQHLGLGLGLGFDFDDVLDLC